MYRRGLLTMFCLISQVFTSDNRKNIATPDPELSRQNIATNQFHQQINASIYNVIQNMAAYQAFMAQITDQLLRDHQTNVQTKTDRFKVTLRTAQSRSLIVLNTTNPVVRCVVDEANLDLLAEEVNEQIKRCATVSMAEMVNVISDSLNEAQAFMTIPEVIGKDIQRCGLSHECQWDIVADAISESLQVPPKVFALTAKIQSIALRTVISIDKCGIQGLRKVAETGMEILGDIFACISVEIDSTSDEKSNKNHHHNQHH